MAKPPIIAALQGESTPQIPFWLMRQAGRYLPEYRELRKNAGSFLNLCFNPELACEVTLQPLKRFDMDAAILFSDILVVPHALGQQLDFMEGEGPRLGPLRIASLKLQEKKLEPVYETVRRVRQNLGPEKTLIGFAGSPWTVACYMVQGQGGNDFPVTRHFAEVQPEKFKELLTIITDATVQYLRGQIASGAQAIQLFDSWANLLNRQQFVEWSIAPTREIVRKLKSAHPDIPIIGFPRAVTAPFYKRFAEETGVDALGLDQLATFDAFPPKFCLQGNLDPTVLLKGGQEMKDAALKILNAAGKRPFVFNLAHGIIKDTPPEHVAQLSSIIREFRR
ncbi:MAG: uroporphyrinogen decarboxylase [Alphaproteobacteria bacterium]